jgi:hypothetical protein
MSVMLVQGLALLFEFFGVRLVRRSQLGVLRIKLVDDRCPCVPRGLLDGHLQVVGRLFLRA